jgi:hypothetical protein
MGLACDGFNGLVELVIVVNLHPQKWKVKKDAMIEKMVLNKMIF